LKPFLEGKKSLAVEPLRIRAATRPPMRGHSHAGPALAAPGAAASHVEVVKEGDKIARLVVHCSCGERIEVECLYPAGH
jgi:hypothetical protein